MTRLNIVAKTTSKEFNNLVNAKEVRQKVFQLYREKYVGTSVRNLDTGIVVNFDGIGAKKTAHGGLMYAKKASIINILDKVIKHGHFIGFGFRKQSDQDKTMLGYLNFISTVVIDEKIVNVYFSVRLKKDGTFHYHIETQK